MTGAAALVHGTNGIGQIEGLKRSECLSVLSVYKLLESDLLETVCFQWMVVLGLSLELN